MDHTVVAIVGARLTSSRLPAKQLLPLEGESVIGHILRRLSHSKTVTHRVIGTTSDLEDKPLVAWAMENNVSCYTHEGSVNHLVDRIHAVVEAHNPAVVVYLCGDCPLLDPTVIDAMVEDLLAQDAEYATIAPRGENAQSINEGIQVFSRQGWDKLKSISTDDAAQEHVGSVLAKPSVRASFKMSKTKIANCYFDIDHRISIDTHADYLFIKAIYRLWYLDNSKDSIVDLPWVIAQLIGNSNLRSINDYVSQRTLEKAPQILAVAQVSATIGLGHLIRSLRACIALQEYLGSATYLFIIGDRVHHPLLRFVNHCFFDQQEAFESYLEEELEKRSSTGLIFDFHSSFTWRDPSLPNRINEDEKTTCIALDNLAPKIHHDLVWVPCFLNTKSAPLKAQKIESYHGWDSYFLPNRAEVWSSNAVDDDCLLLTGGSDAYGIGLALPSLMEQELHIPSSFRWIQGPLAPTPQLLDASRHEWRVIKNPQEIHTEIAKAKLVISVYGMSAIEAMSLGKAVILIDVGSHHKTETSILAEQGMALVASDLKQVPSLILRLIDDEKLRSDLEEKARGGIGDGARAFAEAVKDAVKAMTKPVEKADSELTLETH